MPIYEYRCKSCGHEMEVMQRMSDARLTQCPVCGKPTLKKLVSASRFRLAGSGWYETDFKKGNKHNLVTSSSADSSNSAGSGNSTADSGGGSTDSGGGSSAGGGHDPCTGDTK